MTGAQTHVCLIIGNAHGGSVFGRAEARLLMLRKLRRMNERMESIS